MLKAFLESSQTEDTIIVLGAPYGGHKEGKDEYDQYFDANTNFLENIIPRPPVFHFHGAKLGAIPYPIGETVARWTDDFGVWYKVKLFVNDANQLVSEKARQMIDAAKSLALFASTGAVQAAIKLDKATGHIQQWLIGELSLIDTREVGERPANYYAIAQLSEKAYSGIADKDGLDRLGIKLEIKTKEEEVKDRKDRKEEKEEITQAITETGLRAWLNNVYKALVDRGIRSESLAEVLNAEFNNAFTTPLILNHQEAKMKPKELNVTAPDSGSPPDNSNIQGQIDAMSKTLEDSMKTIESLKSIVEQQAETIKAQQTTIEVQQLDTAIKAHEAMINGFIAEGVLTPGEKEAALNLFSYAHSYDSTVKAGEGKPTMEDALVTFIKARPKIALDGDYSIKSATTSRILSPITETSSTGNNALQVNSDYLDRMRAIVDLPASQNGAGG